MADFNTGDKVTWTAEMVCVPHPEGKTDRNGNISGSDPNLTFSLGDTINFVVSASGHPFYLKTVAGTGTGNAISGVTNNGSESATITWTPTATGTFYYQCSVHGGMVGTITIIV